MNFTFQSFPLLKDRLTFKMNADKLFSMLEELHINGVDIMDYEIALYGKNNIKKASEKHHVDVSTVMIEISPFIDEDKIKAKIEKAVLLCKDIRAKYVLLVPNGYNEKDRVYCESRTREELLSQIVKLYSLAVKRFAEENIVVTFKNTPHYYKPVYKKEDVRFILDNVEGLKFIFDPGNCRVESDDVDIIEYFDCVKDRVVAIHVEDTVKGDYKSFKKCFDSKTLQLATFNAGDIDYLSFFNHIKEEKGIEFFSIEYARLSNDHKSVLKNDINLICSMLNGTYELPQRRMIKGLDRTVSPIFYGTANSKMMKGKDQTQLLDLIYASGINAFDTARGYGGSETTLGKWIKNRNNREKIVILSKCGNVSPILRKVKVNRQVILKELEVSLKNLNTDYIDIYMLHRDDPNTPISEIMETLNEIKKQGKVKIFGVSNWSVSRIKEANKYAQEHNLEGFTISSPQFSLGVQEKELWGGNCVTISGEEKEEDRNYYIENKIPVISYSSFARGFFSGRFKAYDYEGAKKNLDGFAVKGFISERNMRRLKNAEELAKEKNVSVSDIALSYVISMDENFFAIVSTTSVERLKKNINSVKLKLTKNEIKSLEK